MSDVAAIVLAHDNPSQVQRLIGALDGLDIFLHCDRRASDGLLARMLEGAPAGVHVTPRVRTHLFGWSLVEAELLALRTALERSSAEHLVVMSGSCYPLMSVDDIGRELEPWRGRSRIAFMPLPFEPWGTRRNDDGGLWRVRRRFVTFRGSVVRVGGVPLRGLRRETPKELRLHGADQWKVYARAHAQALLRVLDERPDLVRFWRGTFVPDELCVPSILGSPELVGEIAESMAFDLVWYVDWEATHRGAPEETVISHPRWLALEDFDELAAARWAPPRIPGETGGEGPYRKLFARKFTPREARLVALIDERLRV
jgi:hypothetical protein